MFRKNLSESDVNSMSRDNFDASGQRLEKFQNNMPNVAPTVTPKVTPKVIPTVTQKIAPNVTQVSLGFGLLIRSKHFLAEAASGTESQIPASLTNLVFCYWAANRK